jgi:hypothetical protein
MDLPVVLSLISTAAIVCGVVFAGYELRLARRQRAREAELLLARSFQTPEFMRALDLVVELADGLSRRDIEALGPEAVEAIGYWCGSMESLGVLVHTAELRIELVEDFMSGPIVVSWRKLEPFIRDRRRTMGRDTMHEWFQWLAERITAREAAKHPTPANIEFGAAGPSEAPGVAAGGRVVPSRAPDRDGRTPTSRGGSRRRAAR